MAPTGDPLRLCLASVLAALVLTMPGCSTDETPGSDRQIDRTPSKLDGSESTEFEADDIERAEEASAEVEAYCAGAVSEAQEAGCLSHVDDSDLP